MALGTLPLMFVFESELPADVICSNCKGINDINIPCSCPPERGEFIRQLNANVAAGHAINNPSVQLSFPQDNSKASALARFHAATVTLQNLNGPGVGCPQVATTWSAQVQAIQNGPDPVPGVPAAAPPPPPPAAPAPPPPPPAAPAAGGVNPALIPEFGVQRGDRPDGTGYVPASGRVRTRTGR